MCEEYDQTCSNKYLNKCIPQHSRMHVVQYMCRSYAHEHVCIRVRMSACVRMAHMLASRLQTKQCARDICTGSVHAGMQRPGDGVSLCG